MINDGSTKHPDFEVAVWERTERALTSLRDGDAQVMWDSISKKATVLFRHVRGESNVSVMHQQDRERLPERVQDLRNPAELRITDEITQS
jgi:hypothetical protein